MPMMIRFHPHVENQIREIRSRGISSYWGVCSLLPTYLSEGLSVIDETTSKGAVTGPE